MSVAENSSVMDTSMDAAASASMAAPQKPAAAAQSTRPDGRLPTELRPISVEHGLLNRADGSVQWTQGQDREGDSRDRAQQRGALIYSSRDSMRVDSHLFWFFR